MIIAKVQVSGVTAKTLWSKRIPHGIIGAQVSFEFDSAWQSLRKTVVFRGCCTKDILDAGDVVTIPAEVVAKPGVKLWAGVYGVNAEGSIAIPTLWAELGNVWHATDPSGDESTDPTLPVWAQLQALIGDLDGLDTEAKSNLVAAVNELAASCSTIPYIGENGNWWIGNTNTGIRAGGSPQDFVALATGTAIVKNTDLDTVTTFDNYKCTSSAIVKTLLNCPVDTPFIMRVGSPAPGVANYFYQEIITLRGVRYYRYGQPSSGVLKWNNWRQTFDTNSVIPARYGGMGANISSDLGETAHLDAVQRFIDKMNEMAESIGMTNTTYKTPSGLPRKPVNADKETYSTEYNSYTTAHDLLRLMVAVRHTPTVLTAMGSARCDYFRNGGAYYANHFILGNDTWLTWAEEHGYTILAAKGGSLSGVYGEIGSDGILNYACLIRNANGDVFAVGVVGLTSDETDTLRTIIHDLIGMAGGGAETAAISEANGRTYPVGMAVAKLTDGCFDDDITALESGTFYNGDTVRVAASVAKIMAAITAVPYMGNHACSVTYDDLVGSSGIAFVAGDTVSTPDALSLMLAVSDNAMATMLARVCGMRIGGGTGEAGVGITNVTIEEV